MRNGVESTKWRARPGPERECRPPEGGGGGSDAVCSGASWPRAPWGPTHCAGLARDLAAVEPPLEVRKWSIRVI